MVGATPADSNPCLLRLVRSRHNRSSRNNPSGLNYTVRYRVSTIVVQSVSIGLGVVTMTGQLLRTDSPHRESSNRDIKKDKTTGFEVMTTEKKHNSNSDSNLMTADSRQGENGDPKNEQTQNKGIRGCNEGRQIPIPGAETECSRTANRSQHYFLPSLLPPIAFAGITYRLL